MPESKSGVGIYVGTPISVCMCIYKIFPSQNPSVRSYTPLQR